MLIATRDYRDFPRQLPFQISYSVFPKSLLVRLCVLVLGLENIFSRDKLQFSPDTPGLYNLSNVNKSAAVETFIPKLRGTNS